MSERFGVFVLSNESDDRVDAAASTLGLWSSPAAPIVVRYDPEILEQIRLQVVEKFMSIPRGGLEVGGVLFGTIEDVIVTIRAYRPLLLEYQTGPSFVLSANDEDSLRSLLTLGSTDPDLKDLAPVGWYHSHTRSEVFLSPEDVAVHDKFFPGPAQVALVVRPLKFKPAKAGFFVREPDGTIRADSSYQEFELDTGAVAGPRAEFVALTPAGPVSPAVEPEHHTVPVIVPLSKRTASRRNPAILTIVSATAVFALLLALLSRQQTAPSSPGHASVALRLTGSGENIQIEWDQRSKEIHEATRGALEIFDGRAGKVSIPLQPDSLRQGNVTYARTSESVEVRLRLYRNDTVTNDSVAHFAKPLPSVAAAPVEQQPVSISPIPQPAAALADETIERGRIAERIRKAVLPNAVAPKQSATVMPGIDQAPLIAVSSAAPTLPVTVMPAPPPPRVQAPAPQTASTRPPASGRAIWTGELRRGGIVMFSSGGASAGAISGRMPSGPVRITARPAELIDGGMLIYTSTAATALSESPSARNGWNLTVYRHDPRRVRDLSIVEMPSERNNWKLVLRSEAKAVGVIVLDWQELAAPQNLASNP
jgi:proteasome lid subunit RPN8/RPN11